MDNSWLKTQIENIYVQVARALCCRMIRMSDFDIFFRFHQQIKCQKLNFHRECFIQAFSSKNMGPEKVMRN